MTTADRPQTMGSKPFNIRAEIGIIPGWAFVLATAAFIGLQILFHAFLWAQEGKPLFPFQVLLPLILGLIPAFLVLLIGYVNRDAGRRGMSRALWTLLVIFIPNGIGFIVYFLVRNPVRIHCPECGTEVDQRSNYCPSCRNSLRPTCPQCQAPAMAGHTFCTACGHQLEIR